MAAQRLTPRHRRPRCGAKTRAGHPCRAPVAWDAHRDRARSIRCKLHGGLSTGPRTAGGRARIALANARRAILRDLDELAPDLEPAQRERWTTAIVAMAPWGGRLKHGAAAVGVSTTTIHRWSKKEPFAEALRRKLERDRQRRRRRWLAELRADALRRERRMQELGLLWFAGGPRRARKMRRWLRW